MSNNPNSWSTYIFYVECHAKRRQELNVSIIKSTLSRTPQSVRHDRESQESGYLNACTLLLKETSNSEPPETFLLTLHPHSFWYLFTQSEDVPVVYWTPNHEDVWWNRRTSILSLVLKDNSHITWPFYDRAPTASCCGHSYITFQIPTFPQLLTPFP